MKYIVTVPVSTSQHYEVTAKTPQQAMRKVLDFLTGKTQDEPGYTWPSEEYWEEDLVTAKWYCNIVED